VRLMVPSSKRQAVLERGWDRVSPGWMDRRSLVAGAVREWPTQACSVCDCDWKVAARSRRDMG